MLCLYVTAVPRDGGRPLPSPPCRRRAFPVPGKMQIPGTPSAGLGASSTDAEALIGTPKRRNSAAAAQRAPNGAVRLEVPRGLRRTHVGRASEPRARSCGRRDFLFSARARLRAEIGDSRFHLLTENPRPKWDCPPPRRRGATNSTHRTGQPRCGTGALEHHKGHTVFTLHGFGHVCPRPAGVSLRPVRSPQHAARRPTARPPPPPRAGGGAARRRLGAQRSALGLSSPPGGASSRRWRSRDGSASAAAVTWARVEGHGAAMELSAYAQGGCRLLGDPRRLSRRAYSALLRAAFRGVLQPHGGVGERERAAGLCVGRRGRLRAACRG